MDLDAMDDTATGGPLAGLPPQPPAPGGKALWLAEAGHAWQPDQLHLLYQPLASLQDGGIASVEALLRWQHPEQGLLVAADFVPEAEAAGRIGALGEWALRRACADLAQWLAALPAPAPGAAPALCVSVNIAAHQLHDAAFPALVQAVLREHGLAPASLLLELTEAALLQDAQASLQALHRLKGLGVQLVLDDFGTGYSSLGNPKRFPFDYVKIDCSFIRDVVSDRGDAALTKTIIAMAHHLGLKVVAEGVETEAQCDFLRRNMCDLIQGYFFSPPLGQAAIGALLAERRSLPPELRRIQRQKRSLLLVDDEPNILAALKRLLRRDDYTIHTAGSGAEGLDILARHPVDVIVSDQRMPGMIGADFLRKAKDLYPDTIRIMLSGYTELQSVTEAVNEGAIYKFLTKPWDDELLRGHVAQAFRLKEIADDNERLNLELRSANQELAAANRRMEELLQQKQRQISRHEVSLNVAREVLQHLPLPVIGMDDGGLLAFVNSAAARLFGPGAALLGSEAAHALPELFPSGAAAPALPHDEIRIGAARYAVVVYPMGESSSSRGSLITLNRCMEPQ
ncbi:EAL domain-containing protein [Pseudoduganella violacea]|uniref:EAL domain-containing protein (Putative c-di-GMP-specific phosphodiesterase class I)/CheY-like chemotaxis protein n=1 Tax=Pseudoduganella violacea TaxID=1715466 RepID=A0A7W5B8N7_9BURK|nr:EAL domain-containing protein [Pseudoduganella violacea]MBB3118569.1 EAL domain-containing protein (putative c-di-GMP-specific phosphodiesterase class I)/CheY-like chemotaxis protein [Pseudoduganella violacea]